MDKKLKIVAVVHGYFPNHNAGAEAMLHQILLGLKEKGHLVRVVTRNPGAKEYEGIPIFDFSDPDTNEHIAWSDIVFTHLDFTRRALILAQKYRKKIVHLVHNDKQLQYNKVKPENCHLAIANSDWIKKTIRSKVHSVVLYPPTLPERYRTETTRETITLINMNEAKGGKMFWQLARIFPDKKFLGVKGAYGEQIGYEKELDNVEIYDNSPDVNRVYSQSRIVLMPSSYESWGRVAMEALCSGIPVIASPTPGLQESLDYAGIFAEHDDVAGYVEAIRMLDDAKVYNTYSDAGKKRSEEVANAFRLQLDEVEKELYKIL